MLQSPPSPQSTTCFCSLIPIHSTQEDTFTPGTPILIVYSPSKSAQVVTSALSTTETAQVRDLLLD